MYNAALKILILLNYNCKILIIKNFSLFKRINLSFLQKYLQNNSEYEHYL